MKNKNKIILFISIKIDALLFSCRVSVHRWYCATAPTIELISDKFQFESKVVEAGKSCVFLIVCNYA
jgi:hypothetical protein